MWHSHITVKVKASLLLTDTYNKIVKYLIRSWAFWDTFTLPQEWIHHWHNNILCGFVRNVCACVSTTCSHVICDENMVFQSRPASSLTQEEEPGLHGRRRTGISICLFLCLSRRLSGFVWRPEGKANKIKSVRPLALTWPQLQVMLMLKVCYKSQHLGQHPSEGWCRADWIIQTNSVISSSNENSIMHSNRWQVSVNLQYVTLTCYTNFQFSLCITKWHCCQFHLL